MKTQIYEVRDGEFALNFLFNRGKYADKEKYPRPDVVLLDLRLPKVDGTEVLRQIKESRELRDLPLSCLLPQIETRTSLKLTRTAHQVTY